MAAQPIEPPQPGSAVPPDWPHRPLAAHIFVGARKIIVELPRFAPLSICASLIMQERRRAFRMRPQLKGNEAVLRIKDQDLSAEVQDESARGLAVVCGTEV